MEEVPLGSGHYTATVLPFFPHHGEATVYIHLVCPDHSTVDIDFPIYIDPSGVVKTVGGTPLEGAIVTLFRSDTGAPDSFGQVPDGSAVMSPANRSNPDMTNEFGQFGWDVIAGYYKVRAEKEGCSSPDHSQAFVESAVLTIPPTVIDLDLRLDCGEIKTIPEMLEDMAALVKSFNLKVGLQKSFDNKLMKAKKNYLKGKTKAACNTLRGFIKAVQKASGKKLTPSQASQLINAATAVRTKLGCS